MRYKLQPLKRLPSGKRAFQTTHYPTIPKRNSDIYLISTDGDRLDIIANQYYGRPDLWWVIASANNIGKGTLRLQSGMQFRVPTEIDSILLEFEKLNK